MFNKAPEKDRSFFSGFQAGNAGDDTWDFRGISAGEGLT